MTAEAVCAFYTTYPHHVINTTKARSSSTITVKRPKQERINYQQAKAKQMPRAYASGRHRMRLALRCAWPRYTAYLLYSSSYDFQSVPVCCAGGADDCTLRAFFLRFGAHFAPTCRLISSFHKTGDATANISREPSLRRKHNRGPRPLRPCTTSARLMSDNINVRVVRPLRDQLTCRQWSS